MFCAESETFLRVKRPQWQRARRNGCFHRLPQAELLDEYKQLRGFNLALPPNSHFFLQNIYTSGGTENNDTDINNLLNFWQKEQLKWATIQQDHRNCDVVTAASQDGTLDQSFTKCFCQRTSLLTPEQLGTSGNV